MKLIFVCSPLRGNIEDNIKKANEYCRQVADMGDCGIAPHCVFTQYLDDNNPQERQIGMDMALELLKRCDELLVCGERISEGMKEEIRMAHNFGIPVKCLTLPAEEINLLFKSNNSVRETVILLQQSM